jgi:hypothetical protein
VKLATIAALAIGLQTATAIAQSQPAAGATSKAVPVAESALDGNYAVCALEPVFQSGNDILYLVNVYEESCNDVPYQDYAYFTEEFDDLPDCSTCYQCRCRGTGFKQHSNWASFAPLRKKVPIQELPLGLNPNLKEVKSVYAKLKVNAASEAYFRIFKFIYYNPSKPTKSCSFTIGMEMETPPSVDALPSHQPLVELKDCVALSPHAYALKKGPDTILLLRAGVPTPASE